MWSSLINIVGNVLEFLYGITGNYGLAIILLTIIIRLLLYPLMQKQMTSMRQTQKIQPLMQEIQRKYKDDKEKQSEEMMRLYKEHKINPMGGCLPMLIQMPILILLFQALRVFDYKIPGTNIISGGFWWIKEKVWALNPETLNWEWIAGLALPDSLFGILPESVPMIGGTPIGILPILVGATMYIQQKLTTPAMPASSQNPGSASSTANTQKMMTTIMPLMIGFISFTLPSGLSLYWVTSTIFGIVQQIVINKKEPVTIANNIKENNIQKEEENKGIDKKNNTNANKEKSIKTIKKIKQEDPWIPGYENSVSQQNKRNVKKGKSKKNKV